MWADIPMFLIRSRGNISRFTEPAFVPDFEAAEHIGLTENIGLHTLGLTTLSISDQTFLFSLIKIEKMENTRKNPNRLFTFMQ